MIVGGGLTGCACAASFAAAGVDVVLLEADRVGAGETARSAGLVRQDLDASFQILNALYFNRGFTMPDAYFAKEQGMYSGEERHTYGLFGRPIAPIRRDPRFAVLTRELGLDDYWRRTNSRLSVIA